MYSNSSDILCREAQGERKEVFTDQKYPYAKEVFLPMWPNGQVRPFSLHTVLIRLLCPQKMTYCFHSAHPGTPLQQRKVKQVIEEWEKQYTNVHFDLVDQDATIRITFDSCDRSWSLTGCDIVKSPPSDPTMNLGGINNTTDIITKDIIEHYFCSCLGLEGRCDQSPVPCIGLDPRFLRLVGAPGYEDYGDTEADKSTVHEA